MSWRSWTPEEDARLRELYPCTTTNELPGMFGRSRSAVRNRARNLRLRKASECNMRRPWRAEDDGQLRELYPDASTADVAKRMRRSVSAVYGRAKKLGVEKSEAYRLSPAACRLRRGDNVGAAYRFQKGHAPANKGLRRPGWSAGRMRETQFRKGEFPANHDPDFYVLGALRVNTDGYIDMRVSFDPGALGWKPLHRILWEDEHGPVPDGYALTFKDRDRLNVDLPNLELISRADLARRNSIHNLPPELKGAITALATLKRKIRREEQNRGSTQPPVRNDRRSARRGEADGHRAR